MRYLMLIKHAESIRDQEVPPHLMTAMEGFIKEKTASGELTETAGLKGTADGFRVRLRRRKVQVTDGPFTETKEIVGGYAMLDVRSRDDALVIAREFVELHRRHWPGLECECEVRAVDE